AVPGRAVPRAGAVAGWVDVVAVLAGDPPDVGDPGLSRHVLLLQEGVLPRVLRRPAGVRGGRAPWPQLPWRDGVSVHSPEPAPLLPLPIHHHPRLPLVRQSEGLLLP